MKYFFLYIFVVEVLIFIVRVLVDKFGVYKGVFNFCKVVIERRDRNFLDG